MNVPLRKPGSVNNDYTFDPQEICKFIDATKEPGEVFELRVPKCKLQGEYRKGTYSGYFDREHCDELVQAIGQIEWAPGVYITMNPVIPACHARAYNHARIADEEAVTNDKQILRRKWLLIDVDTVRPAGISASDEEKQHAAAMVTDIDAWLSERGFPPGIIADSGNGAHLILPANLPADDDGICEQLLKQLAASFNSEHAQVDTTTANASRIWKLPGTMSCKGDHCPQIGRPWRMARMVSNNLEEVQQ